MPVVGSRPYSPWMTKTEVAAHIRKGRTWIQENAVPWTDRTPPRPFIRRRYIAGKKPMPLYWRRDVEENCFEPASMPGRPRTL